MKKLIYSFICIVMFITTMTSCKDFLDTSSPSDATPEFVFSDATTARAALMEAYEKWRAKAYVHANGLFYDLVIVGSDSERHPEAYASQVRHIPENLYSGGTATFNIDDSKANNGVNAWPALYSIISTCNTLCNAVEATETYTGIKDGTATANDLTDLYGQAIALRATAYFELLRFWGDVPHNLIPGKEAEGLTPRDQIYEYHINKLIEVEPYMYRLGESAISDATVMTRNYVEGLIGRMCLYAGGYSTRRTDLGSDFYKDLDGNALGLEKKVQGTANNAIYARRSDYLKFYEIAKTYLQKCIDNSGTATLCTNDPRVGSNGQTFGNPYQYIFQQNMNLTISSESIYEIPETRGVQSERPYAFGRPSTGSSKNNYPCKNYGQSRFHPTYYYGDFDPNDMRRDVTCTVTGTIGASGTETLLSFAPGSQAKGGGIANNKWDENRQPDPYWQGQRKSGINNPYMRMSDIILMQAEVEAELGDDVSAKMNLAAVHNRAFATETLANLDGFIAKCGGMKEAIAEERKLEFGGEGLRRYDLIRTGQFPTAIENLRSELTEMIEGLKTKGYYTFDNGNTISNYIWVKSVDEKSNKGYRLTTQCPDNNDPVLFPGWRGVYDDWEGLSGNIIYNKNQNTNLAIKGLLKHIEPGSAEAKALEDAGYKQTDWGETIIKYKDEYSTYVFCGYVEGEAPIYFVPFTTAALKASNGKITNGYGFSNASE